MPRGKRKPSGQQTALMPVILEPLLTMSDIEKVLQLSKPKIYELMAQGLPSLKIDGARRFQPSAVKAWIDQQAS
ncbi:MAG TPA: helix-turn-helix domain-containing protein [Ktedonobacteraceae bacterium]|nr:helix-turn-helix domain-containing protein [Ktedonobacteraceae bacterium]